MLGPANRNISRHEAWKRTLADFFRETKEGDSGKKTKAFLARLPSEDQFLYFLSQIHPAKEINDSHLTSIQFGTSKRATTSDGDDLKPKGPGDVYQVDSTLADIYLVNSYAANRPIGRPVLYLVVDVWTKMIVGFHVTLNSPSYEEACIAVTSVLQDKKELCKQYDIEISSKQWSNSPFCSTLISDRQEFLWKKSDTC